MCRVEIEVSNPRNDLADRNLGKPRFRSARSFLGLETSISTRHTYKILIFCHFGFGMFNTGVFLVSDSGLSHFWLTRCYIDVYGLVNVL